MKFYTYILYSKTLDGYYTGHTGESLEVRLRKHLSSHKGYTSRAKDWTLYYYETYSSKSEAYRRELDIKRRKSKTYIESLVV